MFFEENKSESDIKLEYLTFTDFGERSDNLDYATFLDLRGAFYYKSYSYLLITSILYLLLSFFWNFFLFLLFYNFLVWNGYYQADIDSLHGQADFDAEVEGEALPFLSEEKDFIDPSLLFFYDLFGLFITDSDDMITCCDDIFTFDLFSHFFCINKSCNFFIKVINFDKLSDLNVNLKKKLINKADKNYLLNCNNLINNFTEVNLLNYYNNYYNNLNLILKKKNFKFIFLQINLFSKDTSKDYLLDFNKFINKTK